jgi:fructose-1,6-bisphosphatase/inositol monophosphatase family enzyme
MDLAAVVDIAERAGRLQVQRRPSLVVKGTKAHGNDLVSDVDLASEQLIGDALTALWPDDGILGEEGHDTAGTSGRRWVVDPLDGTRNYVTATGRWPPWCTTRPRARRSPPWRAPEPGWAVRRSRSPGRRSTRPSSG